MTMTYNYYLKNCDSYYSEIAIINTPKIIVKKTLYFVNSKNENNLKSGIYADNENLDLKKVMDNFNISKKVSDDYIGYIQKIVRYYSYIKVIKDENNSQLEGQNMLFYFGRTIFNKNENYILNNKKFKNIFQLIMSKNQHFPDYSDSFFTNNEYEIDDDFDIESQLCFKVYNKLKIDRRNKLKNIFNE